MPQNAETDPKIIRLQARILAFAAASDPAITQSARDFHRDYRHHIVSTAAERWATRKGRDTDTVLTSEAVALFVRDRAMAAGEDSAGRQKLIRNEWQELLLIENRSRKRYT